MRIHVRSAEITARNPMLGRAGAAGWRVRQVIPFTLPRPPISRPGIASSRLLNDLQAVAVRSRKANMGGTPGQRSTSSASTACLSRKACNWSASAAVEPDARFDACWRAGLGRHESDARARGRRRNLDPATAVAEARRPGVSQAQYCGVELQCLVLVADRDANSADTVIGSRCQSLLPPACSLRSRLST